jgi:hypothetical protein
MKKLLLVLLTYSITPLLAQQQTWPVVSAEEAEREFIRLKIYEIICEFNRTGGRLSFFSVQCRITQLLKQIGTPLSYKINEEMMKTQKIPFYS